MQKYSSLYTSAGTLPLALWTWFPLLSWMHGRCRLLTRKCINCVQQLIGHVWIWFVYVDINCHKKRKIWNLRKASMWSLKQAHIKSLSHTLSKKYDVWLRSCHLGCPCIKSVSFACLYYKSQACWAPSSLSLSPQCILALSLNITSTSLNSPHLTPLWATYGFDVVPLLSVTHVRVRRHVNGAIVELRYRPWKAALLVMAS